MELFLEKHKNSQFRSGEVVCISEDPLTPVQSLFFINCCRLQAHYIFTLQSSAPFFVPMASLFLFTSPELGLTLKRATLLLKRFLLKPVSHCHFSPESLAYIPYALEVLLLWQVSFQVVSFLSAFITEHEASLFCV
eukprot:1151369-Pelagomonas_calceolata.AAC.4